MTDLVVPFITGLTTGGLSCLAVQGGLLANSIARQTEKDIQHTFEARQAARQLNAVPAQVSVHKSHAKRHGKHQNGHTQKTTAPKLSAGLSHSPAMTTAKPAHVKTSAALPILIFLTAKLIAYTALGFLLGALGSVLQLTPITRAIIQLAVGVFMLGSALNMLRVHPIFRYFVIEPPKAVTRFIRRISKNSTDDVATPAFLGALTVLIPCGVTQTMMALAITSANPLSGAAILFSFILGTSPLFFALAYLARRLGQKMEARFMKFAAITVLILALVSIDGGLNLLGSPLSFSSIGEALISPSLRSLTASASGATADINNVMTIQVQPHGYQPNRIRARAGTPAKLKLVTNRSYG